MKKGFTLIELLVVITIIGILAIGGIQVFSEQMRKARDSNRIRDIHILRDGIEQKVLDSGIDYKPLPLGLASDRLTQIRNDLRTYVPNIDNIYEKRSGPANHCLTTGNVRFSCQLVHEYENTNKQGYKLWTRFESQTNIGPGSISHKDGSIGGLSGSVYEIGSNIHMDGTISIGTQINTKGP